MHSSSCSLRNPLLVAASGSAFLWPLLAQAEERGPDELGHFIAVMTVFSVFFLTGCSFVVWLLVSRLRSAAQSPSVPELAPANLDSLWFPAAAPARSSSGSSRLAR